MIKAMPEQGRTSHNLTSSVGYPFQYPGKSWLSWSRERARPAPGARRWRRAVHNEHCATCSAPASLVHHACQLQRLSLQLSDLPSSCLPWHCREKLCHEKASKLLVSFSAATSNLYAQDLKHVHANSDSSARAINKEVDIIRSIIEGQRFDGRR